jgi:hypothetical protein
MTHLIELLNRKAEIVSETNFVCTIILCLETPKYDESKGWFMSGAGQVHVMENSDPRYCVAVFEKDGHAHISKERGCNIMYFKSKTDALDMYERVVEYWECQKIEQNAGIEAVKKFMKGKYPHVWGWGKYKNAPSNPFEF